MNSASCNNTTLEKYTGTSNLTANWTGNNINLHWYNNNTLIENVPSVSASCEYGDVLTPPQTIPTRSGYTFKGWRARSKINFIQVTLTDPAVYWGYGKGVDYCRSYSLGDHAEYHNDAECNDTEFDELEQSEWKAVFNEGTVYGMAKCSKKEGNNNDYSWTNDSSYWTASESELNSAMGSVEYCWCKATGYKPNSSSTINAPLVQPGWIYVMIPSGGWCSKTCPCACATFLRTKPNLKTVLLNTPDL